MPDDLGHALEVQRGDLDDLGADEAGSESDVIVGNRHGLHDRIQCFRLHNLFVRKHAWGENGNHFP
jgi:hypothetical protein